MLLDSVPAVSSSGGMCVTAEAQKGRGGAGVSSGDGRTGNLNCGGTPCGCRPARRPPWRRPPVPKEEFRCMVSVPLATRVDSPKSDTWAQAGWAQQAAGWKGMESGAAGATAESCESTATACHRGLPADAAPREACPRLTLHTQRRASLVELVSSTLEGVRSPAAWQGRRHDARRAAGGERAHLLGLGGRSHRAGRQRRQGSYRLRVQQPQPAAAAGPQPARLTVDDLAAVQVGQRPRHLDARRHGGVQVGPPRGQGEQAPIDGIQQGPPIHELGHNPHLLVHLVVEGQLGGGGGKGAGSNGGDARCERMADKLGRQRRLLDGQQAANPSHICCAGCAGAATAAATGTSMSAPHILSADAVCEGLQDGVAAARLSPATLVLKTPCLVPCAAA